MYKYHNIIFIYVIFFQKVEKDSLRSWMDYIGKQPRSSQMLCDKNNALVSALKEGMLKYLKDVKGTTLTPDKRDPEFMLYEGSKATVNVYRYVKL